MINAVIFDFYGVVCADAYTAWQHQYVPDYHERAAQFADISRRSDRGELPLGQFYEELAKIAGSDPQTVRQQLGQNMKIDQAVLDIIAQLRVKSIKVGLLSNSPNSLYDTLSNFGVRDAFDAVLTSEEAGTLKPDSAIFQKICDKLAVLPKEAVFIDDIESNTAGAAAIGMGTIVYSSPRQLELVMKRLGVELG